MNQDKDLKVEAIKRNGKTVKAPFLKGCQAEFFGLPPHLSGLSIGIKF